MADMKLMAMSTSDDEHESGQARNTHFLGQLGKGQKVGKASLSAGSRGVRVPLADVVYVVVRGGRNCLDALTETGDSPNIKAWPLLAIRWRRQQSNNVNAAVVGVHSAEEDTSGFIGEFGFEEISASLLTPEGLPELWPASKQIAVSDAVNYFAGSKYVTTKRVAADGTLYDESVPIPSAKTEAVQAGVKAAVEAGKLWLVSGVASICGEPIPTGVLTDTALLFPPPEPIDVNRLTPEQMPAAWQGNQTTALGLANQLSVAAGKALPWPVVRDAIDGGIRARLLERTADSGPWPCPLSGAGAVKLHRPQNVPVPVTPPPVVTKPGTFTAEAELKTDELMDLGDSLGEVLKTAVPNTLKLSVRIELGGEPKASEAKLKAINAILAKVKKGLELR